MSTNKTTTNQYNQAGMANYNSFQGQLGPLLSGYMSNPFGNPFYSLNLSQNMGAANQSSMNAIQNAMSQFNMTGMGGAPSGARTSLMSQLGRFGSQQNSQAFLNAANNAFSNQWKAIGTAAGMQPLQTGQKQTQGGLGSWLPQLLAAGIGGASSIMSGGMSSAFGGLGLGGALGQSFAQSPIPASNSYSGGTAPNITGNPFAGMSAAPNFIGAPGSSVPNAPQPMM